MLLETPVAALPATSPLTVKKLKELEVSTYFDLIRYFPHRYEDFSLVSPIAKMQEGETVTVKGTIALAKNEYTRRGFKLQKVILKDASGEVAITWYNQPYLLHVLKTGLPLSVSGDVTRYAGRLTLTPREWEILKGDHIHTGRIVPVYSEAGGLSTKTLREKMFHVVNHLKSMPEPDEYMPRRIMEYNSLIGLHDAYVAIHFPNNRDELAKARRRLGFDELMALQLSSLLTKREWNTRKVKYPFNLDGEKITRLEDFIKNLPFELTQDQKTAVNELKADFLKEHPMNRFLQGDVGSGKTVVAAIAAYISFLNGCKTLIMAPTEILANQHYETISRLFGSAPLKIALQTGSRKTVTAKSDRYDIAVGTHALLSSAMDFKRVGLVVIDEQHRFGVSQRALLKEKGGEPHLLTMTATPIPRTLALTLYGELELTAIITMPKGRIPVKSYLVPNSKRQAAYEWVRNKVKKEKTQVFIICPLIEESDVDTLLTVKAAKKEYEHLNNAVFPELKVALLHGKLRPNEKSRIMDEFSKGLSDILVSTSVVEVGIDIPNASVMIIEGAEKFGLAQLHQLRGRVGRGSAQSYCYLFTDSQEEQVLKRLNYFATHTNGAELAEYDLLNRGPGNIFGTSQHGYMKLRIAHLSDLELIKSSRSAAQYLADKSPDLSRYPELLRLAEENRTREVARD